MNENPFADFRESLADARILDVAEKGKNLVFTLRLWNEESAELVFKEVFWKEISTDDCKEKEIEFLFQETSGLEKYVSELDDSASLYRLTDPNDGDVCKVIAKEVAFTQL